MDELRVGDQAICFDRLRTEQAYSTIDSGGADLCSCLYCRNFAAQREAVYPEDFRHLLDAISIDFRKEDEVYEMGGDQSVRLYGGWFYFSGTLTEAGERLSGREGTFQYYFADTKHLPKPPAVFGDAVAAVEFIVTARWVLSETPPQP